LQAATIYVDNSISSNSCATYNMSSRSCSGGTATAYKDLNTASGAASPGDAVLVRSGTFTSQFTPQKSGTAGNYITFKAYSAETPTITGSGLFPAILLRNRNYLVIDGFKVDNVLGWMGIFYFSYNLIQNSTFNKALDSGTRAGVRFTRASYNKFLNNTVTDGNDSVFLEDSDHNVISGNRMTEARHTLLVFACSNYNVARSNYFSNTEEKALENFDCEGTIESDYDDTIQLYKMNATHHNVFEKNTFAYTRATPDNWRYNAMQFCGQEAIIRNNDYYNNLGGGVNFQVYETECDNNYGHRAYNNTFYSNKCYAIFSQDASDISLKNNLLYKNTDCSGGSTQAEIGSNVLSVNNKILTTDPLFVNAAGYDFHLTSGSPMIDAGAFLTTTASAGSGTSLKVADSKYLYSGYGIPGEIGDTIQLAGQTQQAKIIDIDYTNNILTLDTSLTWNSGQGVGLAYSGSAPDVGSYEYSGTAPPDTTPPAPPTGMRVR